MSIICCVSHLLCGFWDRFLGIIFGSREKWGHVSSILELTEVQFRKSNSVSPIPAAECPPPSLNTKHYSVNKRNTQCALGTLLGEMGKVDLYRAGVAAKITHAAFRPSSIKDLSFARHALPRNKNVSGLLGKQRPG